MEPIVIVGSGPAGLTAAVYAARANLQPLVIEGLLPGGQLTTTTDVENFPGFPDALNGSELVERMRRQAERFGARFLMGEVTAADVKNHPFRLTVSDGQVVETECAIIATGASALYLDLPSVRQLTGRGVSACATCDGAFFRGRRVAVIGGGDSAMEESLFLARLASDVTLIHRREEFRASKIMADRVKAHERIRMALNTVVEEVLDVARNEVTGLRLKDVKTGQISELPVEGVFMAIGHRPNSAAFRGSLDMDENGFIVTTNTRTSAPGVFAAGDVQDHVYKQAVTAAGSGCMAALEAERYLSSLSR